MYDYTLPQWVLFFLFYCFCGWCIESSFVSWRKKRWINRGFLNGPVIPIYGSGAVVILLATLPVRSHPVAVFFLGMAAATVLEYVTGAVMEATLRVRYWDYSDKRFNLHGYVCLNTSLAWGALSVVLVEWLHRPAERLVLSLPETVTRVTAAVLSAIFLADLAVSLRAALDLRKLLEQLQTVSAQAREEARLLQKRMEVVSAFRRADLADFLARKLPDGGEALNRYMESLSQAAERLEQSEAVQRLRADLDDWRARREAGRERLRSRLSWEKRRLLRGNPTARSGRYGEQLRLLRQRLEESRQERRKRP